MKPKLSIIGIVVQLFRFTWESKWRILRALSVPAVIILGLSFFFGQLLQNPQVFLTGVNTANVTANQSFFLIPLVVVLLFLTYIIYTIKIHRLVILGNPASSPLGKKLKRFFIFLGWILVLVVLQFLFSFIFGFNSSRFGQLPSYVWYALLVILLYFVARFSLVYPSAAVDRSFGFEGAWRVSSNNSFRLFIIVGSFPIIYSYLTTYMVAYLFHVENQAYSHTLFGLFSLVGWYVEVALLSLCYKQLTQGGRPSLGI